MVITLNIRTITSFPSLVGKEIRKSSRRRTIGTRDAIIRCNRTMVLMYKVVRMATITVKMTIIIIIARPTAKKENITLAKAIIQAI